MAVEYDMFGTLNIACPTHFDGCRVQLFGTPTSSHRPTRLWMVDGLESHFGFGDIQHCLSNSLCWLSEYNMLGTPALPVQLTLMASYNYVLELQHCRCHLTLMVVWYNVFGTSNIAFVQLTLMVV